MTMAQHADGYTYHTEPPEQGGKRYARCTECGAELLETLGGAAQMIHKRGCSNGNGFWGGSA